MSKPVYGTIIVLFGVLSAVACGGGGNDPETIDCGAVDRVVYLHGNSSGPGTDQELTVASDGTVTKRWNLLNQVGESMGAECLDEQSESSAISTGEARSLIDTVCRSYNETYEDTRTLPLA